MFRIEATLDIKATPKDTWNLLSDVERWWVASNPEHISLEILSEDKSDTEGTHLRIHEKVAGIPTVAEGPVCDIKEGESVTWKAHAIYRIWFIKFPVEEGVTWKIQPTKEGCQLSANVWAEFPASLFGKVSEWIFKNLLNGEAKDREHAMCELRYMKQQLEA